MHKKGRVMERKEVPCSKCGRTLIRAVHFADAVCSECVRLRNTRLDVMRLKRYRIEARRYRIITHLLGWEPEQFEEMVEEMRHSPMAFRETPETPAARRDWMYAGLDRRVLRGQA